MHAMPVPMPLMLTVILPQLIPGAGQYDRRTMNKQRRTVIVRVVIASINIAMKALGTRKERELEGPGTTEMYP